LKEHQSRFDNNSNGVGLRLAKIKQLNIQPLGQKRIIELMNIAQGLTGRQDTHLESIKILCRVKSLEGTTLKAFGERKF
jgi:hypothetical protein